MTIEALRMHPQAVRRQKFPDSYLDCISLMDACSDSMPAGTAHAGWLWPTCGQPVVADNHVKSPAR